MPTSPNNDEPLGLREFGSIARTAIKTAPATRRRPATRRHARRQQSHYSQGSSSATLFAATKPTMKPLALAVPGKA